MRMVLLGSSVLFQAMQEKQNPCSLVNYGISVESNKSYWQRKEMFFILMSCVLNLWRKQKNKLEIAYKKVPDITAPVSHVVSQGNEKAVCSN